MPRIEYRNFRGERLPGVTTIISGNLGWNTRPLMYWAWKEGMEGRDYRETSETAAVVGTIAHAMVEADLKGKKFDASPYPPELVDKAETAYLAWLEWKDLVGFRVVASEVSLIHEELGFGGTLDLVAIKKKRCVSDLKTSSNVYPEHKIQIAAYKELWNYNHPTELIEGGLYLLRIDKVDASFHYHHWLCLNEAWEAFKHLLALHNLQKTLKR